MEKKLLGLRSTMTALPRSKVTRYTKRPHSWGRKLYDLFFIGSHLIDQDGIVWGIAQGHICRFGHLRPNSKVEDYLM